MEDINKTNDEIEIDISALMKLLKKNIKMIVISTVLGAVIAFLVTNFFMTKKYASTARIYLVPKVTEQGVVDSTALNSNSKMVNNYMSLMQGETILSKVADELNIENVEEVKNSLSITNVNETEIIDVKATTDDPKKSQAIVSKTVDIFFKEMQEKLDIKNMTISDQPKVNDVPVSPSKKMNTAIGAMAGLLLSCGYVFLQYLFDKRLKTKAEAESFLGVPVLGEIPWFED